MHSGGHETRFKARSLAEIKNGQLPYQMAAAREDFKKELLVEERNYTLASEASQRQETASKQQQRGWLRRRYAGCTVDCATRKIAEY